MPEQGPPAAGQAPPDVGVELSRKLDTVAGAVAAIAASHNDLLGHVAEAESRRSHDAREVAQRLGALERQVLARAAPVPADPVDPFPPSSAAADLERVRADLALALDVLAQVAGAVDALQHQGPAPVREQLAALRDQIAGIDTRGPLEDVAEDLSDHLTLHTDVALAGALRVIDDRLIALREALSGPGAPGNVAGFEAGAVLGATQAAWTRLEQRLDAEFDDLGRQLQAMVALIERTAATAEALANRPVVTTEQLRKAASAVKDTVAAAGRSRRDRRGGQRGLGPADPS